MKQMTAIELNTLLESDEKPLMIDVREANELLNGKLDDAIHIPMNDVPGRLSEFSDYKNKTVVLICRSGMRSQQVADFMGSQGFNDLVNLQGGMNGWAENVDKSMRVY